MRKRILSVALTLCMVLAMLPDLSQPVTVEAAESSPVQTVKIGTATLNATNKYYHNGVDGAQGTANEISDGANATFDAGTGTLTLNGLNITTTGPAIWWKYNDGGAHNLTINLNGTNNNISNSNGSGIVGESGYSDGPSLTITGSGSLNVRGNTCGIWVWNNITICDGAEVNATGTDRYGICNNNSSGTITFEDSAVVTATGGQYGIGYDNADTNFNVPVIQGGTVTLTGGTAAVRVKDGYEGDSPDLSGYTDGYKVTVGDTVNNSAEWNIGNPLKNYKYIKIEQGSHTHSWGSAWSTNATHHWHECEHYGCGETEASSKDSYGTHVYDNGSDTTCNTCGYTRTPVTTIDRVDITITAPTGGDELPTKASVTAAGVSVTEADITWKKGDTAVSGKAGYNTTYTANVTLAADTGYAFQSGVTARINTNQSGNVTENLDGTITVSYTFPATGTTDLSAIRNPQNITGVANGTAKTATALGLPTVVTIDTKDSKSSTATVTWDLENLASGSYDSSVRTAQTFTVNGTVTLPDGIKNPDNVSLNVVIQVTVSAAGGSGGGSSSGGGYTGGGSTTPSTDNSSKTETTILPDGTKVETTTRTDETTGTTIVEEKKTAPDGTVTEIKTETKKDGSSVETSKETRKDGSTTETATTVDTTGTAQSTVVDKDATTGEVLTVTKIELKDGQVSSVLATLETENAAVTKAKVDRAEALANMKNIPFRVKVLDEKRKLDYKVRVNTADVKANTTLYVYKYDSKTKTFNLVQPEYQNIKSDADANITCNFEKLTSTQRYELVAKDRADRIDKQILATVKVKDTQKSVKENQSTTFAMSQKLNMENVKSIKYSSTAPNVAKVSKSGKITAKGSGTAVIKASVTLLNGKTKTIRMKIKVK